MSRASATKEREKHRAKACFRGLAWSSFSLAFSAMALVTAGVLPRNDYLAFFAPACLFAGYLFNRYAMRLAAEDAHSILAQHPNGFVLLLRCFGMDDYRAIGEAGLQPNFEETLVHSLRHIGPVIAVGRPDEPLPPFGAARLYVDSDDWRAEVTRLMEEARAVVLVLFARQPPQGIQEAQGFRWELQQALSRVVPGKILLVLPAATQLLSRVVWFGNKKKALARKRSFDVFAEAVQNAAPHSIAQEAEGAHFLRFDSSGQPVRLSARRLKYGLAGFIDALQPFFRDLGLPPLTTNMIVLEWRFNQFFRLVVMMVLCGWIGLLMSRTGG